MAASIHTSTHAPALGQRSDQTFTAMDHAGHSMGSRRLRRPRFNLDNVLGSPFFLTSISIAVLGWLIAFISSIAANATAGNFSHFAWWAIMYQLVVIIGTCTAILYGTTNAYQVAICAFLASALSFTTSTTNALIYSSAGAQQAAAAGHIFLSLVNIVWILYFGSHEESAPHVWIDSYSVNKGPTLPDGPRPMSSAIYPTNRFGTPYPKTIGEHEANEAALMIPTQSTVDTTRTKNRQTMATVNSVAGPIEYNYRAKALYSYEANPEDPNELSFTKGDYLEVAGKRTYIQSSRFKLISQICLPSGIKLETRAAKLVSRPRIIWY